jgi:transposase
VFRTVTVELAVEPMDMRADMETALASVVKLFGAARPHHAYLFANRHANRIKMLVHNGSASGWQRGVCIKSNLSVQQWKSRR